MLFATTTIQATATAIVIAYHAHIHTNTQTMKMKMQNLWSHYSLSEHFIHSFSMLSRCAVRVFTILQKIVGSLCRRK